MFDFLFQNISAGGKVISRQALNKKYIKKVKSLPGLPDQDKISDEYYPELSEIIDTETLQSLMNNLYASSGIPVGIIDIKGNILVATGWQDICTRYHRANRETEKFCIESDTTLTTGVRKNHIKEYKCKNNMWDISTPIIVENKHLGNIFIGQFFYEDEIPDYEFFISQAEKYGYDKEKYLEALEKVPRWSRDFVYNAITFYSKLTSYIVEQGFLNQKLQESLAEQKKIRNELFEEKEFLKTILNSIGDCIISSDTGGKITGMNPAAEILTGFKENESRGIHVDKVMKLAALENRMPVSFQEIFTSGENGGIAENSLYILDSEKEYIISMNISHISSSGSHAGHVITFRDMTEEFKLQEQIRQSRKMESIGQLAGGIAHDFNNMLAAVTGSAELLYQLSDNDEKRKYIDVIINSAARASELTSKLLLFSRKSRNEKKVFNISEVLEDAVTILKRTTDKKIEIILEDRTDNSSVTGNRSEIHNAILNICINSVQAISNNGSILIETEKTQIDRKYAEKSHFDLKEGPYIKIKIKDTGSGIPEENIEKLFEPFFTTKQEGKGTGLGLSTVYGTVKSHKGEILISSGKDSGTTVKILLPESDKKPDSAGKHNEISGGKGRILLVDDEENIRMTVKVMLENLGYTVTTAANGKDAVETYKKNKNIDLVIMDMNMPVMSGYEAFEEIKKYDKKSRVIISSGYSGEAVQETALKSGISGILEKPYRIHELSEAVKKLLK